MNDEHRGFPGGAVSFAKRHAWSLSLSGLSAVSFIELAREIGEGELGPLDRLVSGWLTTGRGQWDLLMLTLTRLGELPSMVVVCAVPVLALAYLGRRREVRYLVACSLGSALLCALLKLLFHRARPLATGAYLVQIPDSFSFPSGHAMGAISIFGSLVVVGRVLELPKAWQWLGAVVALSLIVGVGASRIYFGVHYPSDVLGGQLGGAAWVAAMTGWFYPRLLPGEASG